MRARPPTVASQKSLLDNAPDKVPDVSARDKQQFVERVRDRRSNHGGASPNDQQHLVDRVRESLHIKSHLQLLLWLQGEFQSSLPHQIFIAAWGDFSRGLVQHDVVSAIPAVRTGQIANGDISRFIGHLFERWIDHGTTPFGARFEGLDLRPKTAGRAELEAFKGMKSVLVHGIRDVRGRHDCLYVFLNEDPVVAPSSLDSLRIILPFVDTALRQVAHLPSQLATQTPSHEEAPLAQTDLLLSKRELEIMDWVRMGKTNHEIGIILNISTFTVKNHLQRVFRKLDVTNRAQAASQLRRLAKDMEAAPANLARSEKYPRNLALPQLSKAAG